MEASQVSSYLLSEREQEVLRVLGGPGAVVAFQGLRRHLGLHPEILSRTLRRLERGGYVERTEGGYRLGARAPSLEEHPAPAGVPVLEAHLPPGVSPESIAQGLQGRWLGPLRWQAIRDENTLLQWTSGKGEFRVDLRLGAETLTIEVYAREGSWADAVRAAYALFGHLAGEPRGDLAYFEATPSRAG